MEYENVTTMLMRHMVIWPVKGQRVQMTKENHQLQRMDILNTAHSYFMVPKCKDPIAIIFLFTASQRLGIYNDIEHFVNFKQAFLNQNRHL